MKVSIAINDPARTGEFARTSLSFEDLSGTTRNVDLYISFQSLKDFSNNTTSVAFDLLFISALIYGVDNLLERYQFSIDGWARDIEVCLPVNNLDVWEENRTDFEVLLSFLTGDYWSISFSQIRDQVLFTNKSKRWKSNVPSYQMEEYTFASLFSGGLDSLVGVIDGVLDLRDDHKGLLLSHFDSSSPGPNSDQVRIEHFFSRNNKLKDRYSWIQCVVALDNHDDHGRELVKEASFRSRSLLFVGIGLFCIEALPNCDTLIIPENGTISLNYPLTPSRTSTLSTRTTHPHYIKLLQKLVNNIGLGTKLVNPYQSLTKGELVSNCVDAAVLAASYPLSVSCGKRGRKMHWDTKHGTSHCGICMPCIYRRAALHKVGLDNQLYGIDIFTTASEICGKYDFPALFDFLSSALTTEQIRRTLLVAGSLEPDEMDQAAGLVERVREEIKQWIRDKGNDELNRLANT
jgi:hypothetical protein